MLTRLSRAAGCLAGLALGDALGTPTQPTLALTRARYGLIRGFRAPDPDDPFGHAGLRAGQITDDTQAALALVRAVISRRAFSVEIAAAGLLDWLDSINAADSPYVGPSTKAAYQALRRGVPPTESGLGGATNGAAMRVAPLGFLADEPAAVVRGAVWSALPTHNSPNGLAGAAAVAGAVRAAASGQALPAVIAAAGEAARQGAAWYAGPPLMAPAPDLGRRIAWAVSLTAGVTAGPDPAVWGSEVWRVLGEVYDLVGAGMAAHESVPAALALVSLAGGDSWTAALLAANLGGDGDTIGAMAGAIGGALGGIESLPAEAVATLEAVNGLDFRKLARDYLEAVNG
ncbi:MAG: ADP-ribosylglycohydrolase family protein, partial [Anaerolineales bacterium]|nr:ADP-ribosylglycohydrolase family protein [Anaerolineales bacterium]